MSMHGNVAVLSNMRNPFPLILLNTQEIITGVGNITQVRRIQLPLPRQASKTDVQHSVVKLWPGSIAQRSTNIGLHSQELCRSNNARLRRCLMCCTSPPIPRDIATVWICDLRMRPQLTPMQHHVDLENRSIVPIEFVDANNIPHFSCQLRRVHPILCESGMSKVSRGPVELKTPSSPRSPCSNVSRLVRLVVKEKLFLVDLVVHAPNFTAELGCDCHSQLIGLQNHRSQGRRLAFTTPTVQLQIRQLG
mmetsp:Transcript_10437/g.22915  ORF Transcript_10437/g.22915 Transcript_10437/m.22915 type:complete len:249 (-) Transcript_10437:415-1161(-)